MQKLMLLLIIAFLIVSLAGCLTPQEADTPPMADGGIEVESDEFYIGEDKVTVAPLKDAFLYTEFGVDLAFRFIMERGEYDYLVDNFADIEFSARSLECPEGEEVDYSKSILAEIIEERVEEDYVTFSVSVGGIISDRYNTDYVTFLEISFTDGEGEQVVLRNSSPRACAYKVALMEYNNRAEDESEEYCYSDGHGAYTPYSDLSLRRTVLYSSLHVSVKDGVATDMAVGGYYTSPYKISYFDGVLTVEMKNGDGIDTGLLKYLYINGENTYFDLHEGKILLVVD